MDTRKKKDFDALAAHWDDDPIRVKLAHSIAGAIRDEVALKRDMKVLDFGCGTGLLTAALSPYVGSITGLDSSRGMIERLSHKIADAGLTNIEPVCADLEQGDRIPGPYDLIVSSMVFHHIRDIQALLTTIYDLLNTPGTLAVADLDEEGGRFHADATGVFHPGFERNHLRDIFSRAGFGQIEITTATKIDKPSADGRSTSRFTVFLLTAHRVTGRK